MSRIPGFMDLSCFIMRWSSESYQGLCVYIYIMIICKNGSFLLSIYNVCRIGRMLRFNMSVKNTFRSVSVDGGMTTIPYKPL